MKFSSFILGIIWRQGPKQHKIPGCCYNQLITKTLCKEINTLATKLAILLMMQWITPHFTTVVDVLLMHVILLCFTCMEGMLWILWRPNSLEISKLYTNTTSNITSHDVLGTTAYQYSCDEHQLPTHCPMMNVRWLLSMSKPCIIWVAGFSPSWPVGKQ